MAAVVNILQKRIASLDILDINMPKDTQEERTSKNDNNQLEHSVELDDEKGIENWVGKKISVISFSDIRFKFFGVVFINDLFEFFNIKQFTQPWQSQKLQQSKKTGFFVHVTVFK